MFRMAEKENIVCDFTTGVCGPADENQTGVMEFVDLSKKDDEEENEEE